MLELRLQLAAARSALRTAKDDYEFAKAEGEQQAIDSGKAGGKNEAERNRSLTIALAADKGYLIALGHLRQAELETERLEALLEGAKDARRVEEWAIRLRRVEAMERLGIQTDHQPHQDDGLDDDEDDAEQDRFKDGFSHGNPNSKYYAGNRRPQPTYSMLQDEELPF